MGDQNKYFTFTVKINEGKEQNYILNHNTAVITIPNVPVGSNVTIKESGNEGYVVSATVDGSDVTLSNNILTITDVTENGHNVVFTNNKNVTIDTGILLDSMPYILLLIAVGAGTILLLKRRGNREED